MDTIITNVTSHLQVVTGILNAVVVYAVAYHVQLWTTKTVARWARFREGSRSHRVTRNNRRVLDDIETTASARIDDNGCGCNFHHQQYHQRRQSGPRPPPASTEICCGVVEICGGRDTTCQSCLERFRKHISDVSTLCTLSGYTSDSNGPNATYLEEGRLGDPDAGGRGRPADALWALDNSFLGEDGLESEGRCGLGLKGFAKVVTGWSRRNVLLTFSILLFLFVGLPLSSLHHNDLFLDIGFIFTVWLTFTSAQTHVKQHIATQKAAHSKTNDRHRYDQHHPHRPHSKPQQYHRKSLTTLAALLNPVLWTSLFLLCYSLTKSSMHNTSTASVVAQFKTGNTISDLIAHHIDVSNLSSSTSSTYHNLTIPFGAGDLATSILNAGIVSWGLKLFEYRSHLISRGGLTVLLTTAAMALLNVAVWPLLVAKMGVRPAASALSFAARSVTIALGGPAVESVGGDAGINAVGVVVNGICFQLVASLLVLVGDDYDKGGRWTEALKKSLVGSGDNRDDSSDDDHRRHVSWPGYSSDATPDEGGQQVEQEQDSAANVDKTTCHNGTPPSLSSSPIRNPQNTDDSSDSTRGVEAGTTNSPTSLPPLGNDPAHPAHHCHHCHHNHHHPQHDDGSFRTSSATTTSPTATATVVANGITIGINAAAMGTSHLYEQNSPAAAYSALSMTTLGVFTVLFTVPSPLTEWLVLMAGA